MRKRTGIAGSAFVFLVMLTAGLAGLLAVASPAAGYTPRAPIVINGNAEFTGANGVTGGSGTSADPYIISGWEIDGSANSGIEVYNTDAHFVIRDVYLHSALIDGIFLFSVQNARVENATMPLNDIGVYIQVSSNITVAASNISSSTLDAIEVDASSNVTVEGNQMWINGDWGVFAYGSVDLVIRNNTISSNGWAGIELSLGSDRVLVQGNRVANNNVGGLILDQASNVTVVNNTFPDNDFNVDLTNSNDVLIRNNTVATSTSDGITITGGARLTIEENNITGNGGGVLAVGVTALLVRHNAFNGNSPQAADNAGSANAWDDGYPSGGNFWSDYAGGDSCSGPNQDVCPLPDGIGDTPYVIDADSQDRYPLMQPGVPGNAGYTVTVIPPLPGDLFTIPWGVNATGAVVGWSSDGSREQPFLYTDVAGTVPLFPEVNRTRGTARDINAAGVAAGGIYGPDPERAVRWPSSGSAPEVLGVLGTGPFSHAWGVNATGAVVGSSDYGGFSPHAFLYTDAGGMIDLVPGRDSGTAYDVSDAGRVVGYMSAGGGTRAFRWTAGVLEDLGVPGGLAHSYGFAINEAGQVAGCALSATGNTERIVRYTDGVGWEILGGAGDTNCAWGINAYGDVVGHGLPTGTGIIRAFLYTDAGGMQDLERFIDPTLLMRVLDATDINNAGQIVGYVWDNTIAQYRGVRLDPTTLPPVNRPPTVTVLAPNGSEDWTGGSAQAVEWTMTDAEDGVLQVSVDLSTDAGLTFPFPVFSGAVAQGRNSQPWTPPLTDTTTARIRVCVFDSAGASACDASDGDLTIDSTRPTLDAIQPVDGGTDVAVNADIVLTFGEPMNRAATEAAVTISPSIGPTTNTWDGTGQILVMRLGTPLTFGTAYTITVGCGALDDSAPGNPLAPCPRSSTFTTRPPPVAPQVTVTAPAGGEAWTGATIHPINWTMSDVDSPGDLSVDVAYSTDGGATWVPVTGPIARPQGANTFLWSAPAMDASTVVARVCASDGALIGCGTSAPFAVDSTRPTVASVLPGDGSVDTALGQAVEITFSEAMDPASFTPSTIALVPAVLGLVPTWSPDGRILTVLHDPFAPCTTYTATIEAGVRDASDPGNPAATAYSWSFSTVCAPTGQILAPLGGEDWSGGSTHPVRFRVTDDVDLQVQVWLNATLDGTPTTVFSGPVPVGDNEILWTLPATTATATLDLAVADRAGLIAAVSSAAFTIDASKPALLSTDPADGALNTSVDAVLVLTFSEAMDPAATQAALSVAPAGPTMTFSWDAARTTLTVRFAASLAAGMDYAVTVGCGARDHSDPGNLVVGCPGAGPRFDFRTKAAAPLPVAHAVADAQARVGVPVTLDGRGSTGDIASWTWTIADAAGATVATLAGPVVTHTFAATGRYAVTLRVVDSVGQSDEYVFDVLVEDAGAGSAWIVIAIVIAAALAVAGLVSSEPGRVALMTATAARLYARRPKDEKDSEIRGAIRGYVRVHPGDTYMDIKRNLGLNDGVVTYHLARLEKDGLVRSAIRGARKRYFPADMRIPVENGGELHEIQQRILRFVEHEPGMPVAVLAEQLGVSYQLALYHLRKLSHGHRVGLERAGLRLRAYPARRGE